MEAALLPNWLVPTVFLTGTGLILVGQILAYVYRKPGVKADYFWNGCPEDPAPPAFFRMKYVETLIQPSKYRLVYGVTFTGVAMVFAIVFLMVASAISQFW
jgi:hypothetical protein